MGWRYGVLPFLSLCRREKTTKDDMSHAAAPPRAHDNHSVCSLSCGDDVRATALAPTRHLGANKGYASKNIKFISKYHTLLSTTKCRVVTWTLEFSPRATCPRSLPLPRHGRGRKKKAAPIRHFVVLRKVWLLIIKYIFTLKHTLC